MREKWISRDDVLEVYSADGDGKLICLPYKSRMIALEGNIPTKDYKVKSVKERAYRRGVHQGLGVAIDLGESEGWSDAEFRAKVTKMSKTAWEMRNDGRDHPHYTQELLINAGVIPPNPYR